MYRASYEWYDYKQHIFKYAWIYKGAASGWKRVENIKPDLIYDKTRAGMKLYYKKSLIAEHYPFINDPRFTQMLDDKFVTSHLFQEWSKECFVVRNSSEFQHALHSIKTELVVIKPITESGGKGVSIISKKEAKKFKLTREHLIQEFIDSSHGVPGISGGTHDLRLVFINKKIVYCYTREPGIGSLLANLALGGKLKIVPKKLIPSSVTPIIERAHQIFRSFEPRVYTIDIMFDENRRPWVVELNSMPGLYFTPEEKTSMMKMYQALINMFKDKFRSIQ